MKYKKKFRQSQQVLAPTVKHTQNFRPCVKKQNSINVIDGFFSYLYIRLIILLSGGSTFQKFVPPGIQRYIQISHVRMLTITFSFSHIHFFGFQIEVFQSFLRHTEDCVEDEAITYDIKGFTCPDMRKVLQKFGNFLLTDDKPF